MSTKAKQDALKDQLKKDVKAAPAGFKRRQQVKNSNQRFFKPADESVFYGVYVGVTEVEHKGKVHACHVFNEIGADCQVVMSTYATLADVVFIEGFKYEIEVGDSPKDDNGKVIYYKFNVYDGGPADDYIHEDLETIQAEDIEPAAE